MVNVPTLPTNMETTIMYFPASDKSAVIPVLSPTVPNAETSSKTRSRMVLPCDAKISASVMDNAKIQIRFPPIKIRSTANAFPIKSCDMVRLKMAVCFFPLIVFVKDAQIIAKVDVFIPPPVELEEDPTNIRKSINIINGIPRPYPSDASKSTVLNPEVLVTD